MFDTKNVMMLVVLSAGLLTALSATGLSSIAPAFADDDDDECNDNGRESCNEETQKFKQENNCKIVNDIEADDKSDHNANGNIGTGDIHCWNVGLNPTKGGTIVVDPDALDVFASLN